MARVHGSIVRRYATNLLPSKTSSELPQAGQRYSPFPPGCDDGSRRRKPAPHSEQITSLFLILWPHAARCHNSLLVYISIGEFRKCGPVIDSGCAPNDGGGKRCSV